METDPSNDRPHDPPRILSTEVIINPFVDCYPRPMSERSRRPQLATAPAPVKATVKKNTALLSFGDAEEMPAEAEGGSALKKVKLDPSLAESKDQKGASRKESEDESYSESGGEGGDEEERRSAPRPIPGGAYSGRQQKHHHVTEEESRARAAEEKAEALKREILGMKKPETHAEKKTQSVEEMRAAMWEVKRNKSAPLKSKERDAETLEKMKRFQEKLHKA